MSLLKFRKITTEEWAILPIKDSNTRYTVFNSDGTIFGEFIGEESVNVMNNITYLELKNLRDEGKLVAGAFYRITDYETTTTQSNTRSAGHLFDIVIQALSNNELAEVGTAIEREGENYFANAGAKLGAWQIWYDINNDTERYEWADEVNGKGVIYRMIDEHMNDLPYDFKNIQFKRMFDSNGAKFVDRWSLNGAGVEKYLYTFNVIDENDKNNDSTVFAFAGYENSVNSWNMAHHNSIGFNQTYNRNSINKVKHMLSQSVFIYDYDLIGAKKFYGFYYNTIGNDFRSNTIGNGFRSNTIGDGFSSNTIGNGFGNSPYGNNIGDNSNGNTIGDGFRYNTIGDGFSGNTIGDGVYSNTIGNSFNSNTIGNGFGNYPYGNTIGNGFSGNTIGNLFSGNTIGNDFRYNTIGNSFNSNTIGNNFYSNTIGNSFNSNTIGNNFYSNTIGNGFNSNTIDAYYTYCQFGDGVQYVKLEQVGTEGSRYKNITVKAGVIGASQANPLVIEDEVALRNKDYNIEITRSATGRVLMLWYNDSAVKVGKYKDTVTSATWNDL